MITVKPIFFLVFMALGVICCSRQEERRNYREISVTKKEKGVTSSSVMQSPHGNLESGMLPRPQSHQKLQWVAPKGWRLEKSGNMRTATFRVSDGNQQAEGAIIQMQGEAGGLLSNVKMWMKQLQLIVPQDDKLKNWLESQPKFQTISGLNVAFVDLTQMLSGNMVSHTSMLAAVISAGNETVFVKLTGDKRLVIKNREKFKTLCRSIQIAAK